MTNDCLHISISNQLVDHASPDGRHPAVVAIVWGVSHECGQSPGSEGGRDHWWWAAMEGFGLCREVGMVWWFAELS